MEWIYQFPHMDDDSLLNLKRSIDEGFRGFTSAYGDSIDNAIAPVQRLLMLSEQFMTHTPWPVIMMLIMAIAWGASKSWKVVVGCLVSLFLATSGQCQTKPTVVATNPPNGATDVSPSLASFSITFSKPMDATRCGASTRSWPYGEGGTRMCWVSRSAVQATTSCSMACTASTTMST